LKAPKLAHLLTMDDASFRALFSGSPVKRIGVNRFLRNCLIAAGNSGDPGLIEAVRPHLASSDPVTAEAAKWAFSQLYGCGNEEMQSI
jgi:epoxyqueuosine reductase